MSRGLFRMRWHAVSRVIRVLLVSRRRSFARSRHAYGSRVVRARRLGVSFAHCSRGVARIVSCVVRMLYHALLRVVTCYSCVSRTLPRVVRAYRARY
jgi:hypothetical protein